MDDEVIPFKVCDPAMGSGHFLVDAANQMAGLVVELLEEIPTVDNLPLSVTSQPNYWRRLITRHCLYGVDLNPLAVNLAKLSLWLNCFAKEHKLTFIDHHLRQGNSLVGLRSLQQLRTIPKRKRDKSSSDSYISSSFDFDNLSGVLKEVAKDWASIVEVPEDDTDTQKAIMEESYEAVSERLKPLADLFVVYLMDGYLTPEAYKEFFYRFADERSLGSWFATNVDDLQDRLKEYRKRHQFFHWPLEFSDVFVKSNGFSATVGNPPWEVVKTNSQEFFEFYDPNFRSYGKQEAIAKQEELMKSVPQRREKWERYCKVYEQLGIYFREPVIFRARGKGSINTFQLFLEQFFTLIENGRRMGIVVPGGVYSDQGCMPLRQLFFDEGNIQFIYCFENRKRIFDIHSSFKFVLLGVEKGGKSETFKCAFMEHDPEKLPTLEKNALCMSESLVRRFSPKNLSIMEFDSQRDVDLAESIYNQNSFLGNYLRNNWNTAIQLEFQIANINHLLKKNNEENEIDLFPLCRGKNIWILTNEFSSPAEWMYRNDVEAKETTWKVRFVFRDLAASTNERTFIPTVIPAGVPTVNTLHVCPLPEKAAMVIAAITSSFVLDWVARGKVNMHVNAYVVEQLPMVDFEGDDTRTSLIRSSILARACRLICTSEMFSTIWKSCFQEEWRKLEFWYPQLSSLNYGPAHEWQVREKITKHAKNLDKEWSGESGAKDRMPDGTDVGDRAQLRAEIDAYVAHLYQLNREQFSYILGTFPVLKKKEEKKFGEFLSKRKCLEEFDRLAIVLGEKS